MPVQNATGMAPRTKPSCRHTNLLQAMLSPILWCGLGRPISRKQKNSHKQLPVNSLRSKMQCAHNESAAQCSLSVAQSQQRSRVYDGGALCIRIRRCAQWSPDVGTYCSPQKNNV